MKDKTEQADELQGKLADLEKQMEALDKKLKDDTAAAADREAKLHEDIRQL